MYEGKAAPVMDGAVFCAGISIIMVKCGGMMEGGSR